MKRLRVVSLCVLVVGAAAYGYFSLYPLHLGFFAVSFQPVDFAAGNAELERLRHRFGVKYYSWHFEEWFIRDWFDDMREGFFVDVGSWHYSLSSNTFFLENRLQWNGIAIDAQDALRAGYENYRPRTKFFSNFVSDTSTGHMDLLVPLDNTALASGDSKHAKSALGNTETLQVRQITLDALLEREGVGTIDFFSMDIELAEPAALRGFDIQRFSPKLVCIETRPEVIEFIEDYFEKNGYAKIEIWSRLDPYNSFFAPLALVEERHLGPK